jgi:hypothetical protein
MQRANALGQAFFRMDPSVRDEPEGTADLVPDELRATILGQPEPSSSFDL